MKIFVDKYTIMEWINTFWGDLTSLPSFFLYSDTNVSYHMVFNVLFYLTGTKPTRPEKPYILFVSNIKYEVKSKAPFSLYLFE